MELYKKYLKEDIIKLNIYISFEKENKFMAVSSNKGTIHIFSLGSILKY